jgi:hypothetical protein
LTLFQSSKVKQAEETLSQVEWLEKQDALVRLKRGLVSIEIFGQIDGRRIRKVEGTGGTLIAAIQDAAEILSQQ